MQKTADIVKDLSVDIELIIAKNINDLKLLDELKKENEDLKKIVEQHKSEIEELKEKNKLIKIAKSLDGKSNEGNATELKLKINEILREVDRCVALLNK